MFRVALVTASALAALMVGAAAAQAATPLPGPVNPAFCAFTGARGHATIPAGTSVVLGLDWFEAKERYVRAFVKAQTTTVSVDGEAAVDASAGWGSVAATGDGGFVSHWLYDTGIVLAKNQSITVAMEVVMSRPVPATNEDGTAGEVPTGSLFGVAICTITAK